MPERQVREVADRLTKHLRKGTGDDNLSVRVPLGADRHGNPLYTRQGLVPRWVLPELPVPPGCGCPVCRRQANGQAKAGAATTAPDPAVRENQQVTTGAVNTAPPNVGAVFPSPGAVNTASGAVNTASGAVNTAPTPFRSRKEHTRALVDSGTAVAPQRASVCDESEPKPAPMRADDPRWLELRTAYPKTEKSAAARGVLTKALAEGVEFDLILRRLKAFTAAKHAEGRDHRYWPLLVTWLADEGWEDVADPTPDGARAHPSATRPAVPQPLGSARRQLQALQDRSRTRRRPSAKDGRLMNTDMPRPEAPMHDQAAEKAALGSMMISASAADVVIIRLEPGDFYQPKHGTIYTAIVHLMTAGQPVDPISVAHALDEKGDLVRAGGARTYTNWSPPCLPRRRRGTSQGSSPAGPSGAGSSNRRTRSPRPPPTCRSPSTRWSTTLPHHPQSHNRPGRRRRRPR
ncbi:hypothetical protein GCM10027614_78720 [Micromonospora vulcania]